ncbi:MAG: hypothetical protein L3K15_00510 [Thermoplasmata archaeon]|nr:hypothetical protein [Thermoplasmata archaeon]
MTAGPKRTRPSSVADLEGLFAGVAHRLSTLPPGPGRTQATEFAEQGRVAMRRGKRDDALALFLRAHEILDSEEREPELREFPRGLIAYLPRGDPGVPVGPEEDALVNRLRLALRLAAVRRRDGMDTNEVEACLRAADVQFRNGDRPAAVRSINAALGMLERASPPRPAPAGPRDPGVKR